jgi:enoyl-CoA hydratase/carnithine racemase
MSDADVLQLGVAGPVAVLRLDRPDQRNALSKALRDGLVASLDRLATDEAIRAVVITGNGETFCAGFDLKELAAGDAGKIFADAQGYHRVVHTFPKPLLAAVNGPALAGGMDLATMCDLRLAVSSARFGQPQVRLGVPAAFELTRSQMPETMARRLCLTGDVIDAEDAFACGYVSALYADAKALEAGAMEWAGRLAEAGGAMKAQILASQPRLFGG